ncbi:carboxypeptidase-like regulatory domain-containing protein [Falsiroseomonas oryzae]|uniref:carboxypeptidase-like regulatory domain-containing protein n=1 Tax=Falsiroseomonas oryzae TaxID=2766473 RepID=UPI0022EA61CA|nr:carboxypeptidase-like regulatory domain-containing protein [Roseomonas sp. MO-31]
MSGSGRRPPNQNERGRNHGNPLPRGQIAGRVLDAEGEPIAEAQVLIAQGPAHQDIAALTGADGRFAFGGLVAGNYTLRAQATGYGPGQATVVLMPGSRSARVDIELDRAAAVPNVRRRTPARSSDADEIPGSDE